MVLKRTNVNEVVFVRVIVIMRMHNAHAKPLAFISQGQIVCGNIETKQKKRRKNEMNQNQHSL